MKINFVTLRLRKKITGFYILRMVMVEPKHRLPQTGNFRTGTNTTDSYRITADQFDTNRWDSDSDGVSNLDELIAGADPLVSDVVAFSVIQESVFSARCDNCHDNRFPSGDLDLTSDNAYANLVGQSSSRNEGAVLVIPYDPDNCYLVQKMEGADGIVGSTMSYGGPNFAQMVRDWIIAGAF